MKLSLIPGYERLFGAPNKSYEELMNDIPVSASVPLLIMLNNELNSNESDKQIQKRLCDITSARFSREQINSLNVAFREYRKLVPDYDDTVFARRYLLEMIIKELKRNNLNHVEDLSPNQEYDFFLSYLLVMDEVTKRDKLLWDKVKESNSSTENLYQAIWPTAINQYEYNHRPIIAFEMFKLLSFINYFYFNSKSNLKEYINSLSFKSIGNFLHGIYNLALGTLNENENDYFKKLKYISPVPDVQTTLLKKLCINKVSNNLVLSVRDIKKYPLYQTNFKKYMYIDESSYIKKIFRGTFFDLFKKTKLKKELGSFDNYLSVVGKNIMEDICFRQVMEQLRGKHDFIYFDDNSTSLPDAYCRYNKIIFLFEYKNALFPDDIILSPDFNSIKDYIDSRFIRSNEGSNKGIMQLQNFIKKLCKNEYGFDEMYKERLHNRRVIVYPIICHNDFMFNLNGTNEYLNNIFSLECKSLISSNITIKNLTIIDLEDLFVLALKGKKLKDLSVLIERYWAIIKNRKVKFKNTHDINEATRSMSSFNELFSTLFNTEIVSLSDSSLFKGLSNMIQIDQNILDEIL